LTTIKDVAKDTGLSVATISKYMNGGNVLEENRIVIVEAIEKLNYKVNHAARALKTNRTKTIGVLLTSVNAPFFSNICETMEALLKEEGFSVIFCSYYENPQEELNKIGFLLDQGVDGIVLVPQYINDNDMLQFEKITNRITPLVLLDRAIPDYDCDRILADNSIATYTAIEQFVINGHRRIGFIMGPPEISTAHERKIGYERVLVDYSIAHDNELIRVGDYSIGSGYKAMNDLLDLDTPPTAVMGTNYEMTMGAITAVFERKMKIPQDISFIGYDEIQLTKILNPPIATVLQPMEELARSTVEILLKRISGDYSSYPTVQRLKTTFVMKESISKIT